jgi:16S rRNA G966 N2-methylase RsmD
MEFHEVCGLFPLMEGQEFSALVDDINRHGLREPIKLFEGKIVDGRNRYRACLVAGINPRFSDFSGNGNGDLVSFVVSENLVRRHLSESQRAVVALEILPSLEKEAKERQRGGQGGVLLREQIPQAKGKAREQAAKLLNVNPHYISDAKRISQEAPERIEGIRTGKQTITQVKRELKQAEREKRESKREGEAAQTQGFSRLEVADILSGLPFEDASADAVITDPPYKKDAIPLYGALSCEAARILKPGGNCLVMTGQAHLPEVLRELTKHLRYQWTLAYVTPGSSTQVWGRKVKSNWKPVIWLTNGDNRWEHISDVVKSDASDKRFHEWGQSVDGMARLIEAFTVKGQVVVDPFVGGGATAEAALRLGRIIWAADIDAERVRAVEGRLAAL